MGAWDAERKQSLGFERSEISALFGSMGMAHYLLSF
jgi:hypothetical protein